MNALTLALLDLANAGTKAAAALRGLADAADAASSEPGSDEA